MEYITQPLLNDLITKTYGPDPPFLPALNPNHTIPTGTIINLTGLYPSYSDFCTNFEKLVEEDTIKRIGQIKLYGVKIIDKNEIITTIYTSSPLHHNPQRILNEYFTTSNYINYIIQQPTFNLLLHGPPGTGKSKLIETIAKYTSRHIISICLKEYSKYEASKIISAPYFGSKQYNSSEVIIVLEEFDQTVEYLLSDKRNDGLNLGDLLEMFQSSIPNTGQVIIATSNNYTWMKDKLPALFRPGRLTPVEIGYVNQELFDRIVKYYFDIDNQIDLPSFHTIPTSQIIEYAKMANGNYSVFMELFKGGVGI